MKPGQGRALQFGILGTAAFALLSLLLLRSTGDWSSVERGAGKTIESARPAVAPAPELSRSDRAALQDRSLAADASRAGKPAAGAGAEARSGFAVETTCALPKVDRATLTRLHGDKPLTQDHPNVAKVIEVQQRNTEWLMAHPGVVGTGVGLNDKGEIALLVLTKASGVSDIPGMIEGAPVVIWKSGETHARNRVSPQEATTQDLATPRSHPDDLTPTSRFPRPVHIGISSGLVYQATRPYITAGTLGCRVKDANGVAYALSNNHVYANANKAKLGSVVLQPGTLDGGVSTDRIGTLAKFQKINFKPFTENTIDAAIARIDQSSGILVVGTATPPDGYGTPKIAIGAAAPGLAVVKYGRTTGQTTGQVAAISVTTTVGYSSGVAKFVNQISITDTDPATGDSEENPDIFSDSGDSGSLIVGSDRTPVGLLFAGSYAHTLANPIDSVLSTLGVTIDGEP